MIGQYSKYCRLIGQDAVREEAGAGGQETGAKQEKQEEILAQTGSKICPAKRGVTTSATSRGGFTTTAAKRDNIATTQRVPATTSTADGGGINAAAPASS